jgi:hypothetical protein
MMLDVLADLSARIAELDNGLRAEMACEPNQLGSIIIASRETLHEGKVKYSVRMYANDSSDPSIYLRLDDAGRIRGSPPA